MNVLKKIGIVVGCFVCFVVLVFVSIGVGRLVDVCMMSTKSPETLRESVYKFLGQRDLDSILVIGRDGAEEMIFRHSTEAPPSDLKKSRDDSTPLPSRHSARNEYRHDQDVFHDGDQKWDEVLPTAPSDESSNNVLDLPKGKEKGVETREESATPDDLIIPIPNTPTDELKEKDRVPIAQILPPIIPIPEESGLPTSGQHSTDCHFFQEAVWVETFQPDGMKHLGWLRVCKKCRGHLHDNLYCFVGYAQDPWRPSLVLCRRIGHCNCGG